MDELIYQDHNLIVYDETGITEKDYRRMIRNLDFATDIPFNIRFFIIIAIGMLTLKYIISFMTFIIIYLLITFVRLILIPLAIEKKIINFKDRTKFEWNFLNKRIFGSKGFAYYIAKNSDSRALSVSVSRDNDTYLLRVLSDYNLVYDDDEYEIVDEILSFDEICQGDCKRAQIIFYREDDDIIKVKYLMAAA